jgi:DNA-binding NtrC family response regulator
VRNSWAQIRASRAGIAARDLCLGAPATGIALIRASAPPLLNHVPMASFLVVDDDPSTVSGLQRLLTDDGHEVSPFTSGADAVEALSRRRFDAVVTDLEMPRVDGHEVVKATRKHQPHACVVVASTLAEQRYRDLVDAGACIIADKPFEYDEITKAVTECRARGGPGANGKCHMRSRSEEHRLVPLRRK